MQTAWVAGMTVLGYQLTVNTIASYYKKDIEPLECQLKSIIDAKRNEILKINLSYPEDKRAEFITACNDFYDSEDIDVYYDGEIITVKNANQILDKLKANESFWKGLSITDNIYNACKKAGIINKE